jgi:hypothetical protein
MSFRSALFGAIAAVAVAPLSASAALPAAAGTTAAGTAQFQTTGGRYSLPTIGAIRLTGVFRHAETAFAGTVVGSTSELNGSTLEFPDVVISEPRGRVAGRCTIPYALGPVGEPVYAVTWSCSLRIKGAPATPFELTVRAVVGTRDGDATYGIQTTTWVGTFSTV